MIKAIVSDFSKVLLFPKDQNYSGSLNALHKELYQELDYNPLNHFELNLGLLEYYKSLQTQFDLFIFTTDAIQDAPEFQSYLKPVFTEILSAKKMNTDKKTPEAYTLVASHLKLNPAEVLYIDDATENIQAAKTAGMNAILYIDLISLVAQANKVLV